MKIDWEAQRDWLPNDRILFVIQNKWICICICICSCSCKCIRICSCSCSCKCICIRSCCRCRCLCICICSRMWFTLRPHSRCPLSFPYCIFGTAAAPLLKPRCKCFSSDSAEDSDSDSYSHSYSLSKNRIASISPFIQRTSWSYLLPIAHNASRVIFATIIYCTWWREGKRVETAPSYAVYAHSYHDARKTLMKYFRKSKV